MKDRKSVESFIHQLNQAKRVVIDIHEFPDHDTVASAYALSALLTHFGIRFTIHYQGFIDRLSLTNMVDWLYIPLVCKDVSETSPDDLVVSLNGKLHHYLKAQSKTVKTAAITRCIEPTPALDSLVYADVRPNHATIASIMFEYFRLMDIPMSKEVATALFVAMNKTTKQMMAPLANSDMAAFIAFAKHADKTLAKKITQNMLSSDELSYFGEALKNVVAQYGVAKVTLPMQCPTHLLGSLADFLIRVEDYDVVLVTALSSRGIDIAVRSECEKLDAGQLLRNNVTFQRYGLGGGDESRASATIESNYIYRFARHDTCHLKPIMESIHACRMSSVAAKP